MKASIVIVLALFLGCVFLVVGQQAPPPGQPQGRTPQGPRPPNMPNPGNVPSPPNQPNPDPLADVMFPPDLVLGHARELRLTDEQKNFVRGEIQKTMTSFNELQWKLQDEMDVLHDTLKSSSVDEQQALAQLNKVLDLEREIKRLHVGMGIRIKNHLTAEQQAELQKMRMGPRTPPGPGGPPRPNQE